MTDQSMFSLWLLVGGLSGVWIGLFAVGVAVLRLRRDLSRKYIAALKAAPDRAAWAPGAPVGGAASKEDIIAALRDELSAFQADYRSDLALALAESRRPEVAPAPPAPRTGLDRLDHAISLAKAGHKADFIMRSCDLDVADAKALVRFHGPLRAVGGSSDL